MVNDTPEGASTRPDIHELMASEMRYRRLFESAPDGILILDAEKRKITDVNPFMLELLHYTRDEFLGKELWEIGVLKDKEESVAAFEELQERDYIRYDDLPLRTKEGQRREVEFVSNSYRENGHQVIQCNIRDNTDRKKAEDAARQAETNFRNLVESSPGIVYLNEPDPPYSTIYVSPNIKAYGYLPEDWYSAPGMWSRMVHPDDQARVLKEFESGIDQGLDTEIEYRIIAKDGGIHWWQDKGQFIADEDGKRLGWQGIILDITKTHELEHQLRQAQKLESVGLLAGGIAHDFNNMLTAINGYSDLILRDLKKDDPLRPNIEEIRKAGRRSALLTHQLLAFSRKQVLQPVVLDINIVINDTIKMLKRLIGEDIQLIADLAPDIGRATVDPGQFSQIVMNLAMNARDSIPEGGKITVETANVFLDPLYARQHVGFLAGPYVQMAVTDTGEGMSETIKENIFEPFFTTKRLGKGTGLGLATVYGIVKQSGGNIEVYSELGVGTTFKIYLPRVVEEIAVVKIRAVPSEIIGGAETILLVEDEEIVRDLSKQILKECGYTVLEAIDGAQALSICESEDNHIDLLITDVVMPVMGGRELAEILLARLPKLSVLFTSGYTDDAVMRHGVIKMDTNFIQKPFTPESLTCKIREILDNSKEEEA
jgi:PAS domain S-box-containing protein